MVVSISYKAKQELLLAVSNYICLGYCNASDTLAYSYKYQLLIQALIASKALKARFSWNAKDACPSGTFKSA